MIRVLAAANAILFFEISEADSEGNIIGPVAPENTGIEIVGFSGDFGTVIDGTNSINPGTTPAEAEVHVFDRSNPSLGFIPLHVVLEPGAPATIGGLKLTQNGQVLPQSEDTPLPGMEAGGGDAGAGGGAAGAETSS